MNWEEEYEIWAWCREQESGFRAARRYTIPWRSVAALKGDKEMCLDAGMDDYLPKPISVDNLLAAIDRNISSRSRSAAAS